MKTIISFYESNPKMIQSMYHFIKESILSLSETFHRVKYDDNSNSVIFTYLDGTSHEVQITFDLIGNEREAVHKSLAKKEISTDEDLMSVINIGSSLWSRDDIPTSMKEAFKPFDEYIGKETITEHLEKNGIKTLLIPYVEGTEYRDKKNTIRRAQIDNELNNDALAQCENRHLSYVDRLAALSAGAGIPKEDIALAYINNLLVSTNANCQMLGEIFFKAIFPEDFEKSSKLIEEANERTR